MMQHLALAIRTACALILAAPVAVSAAALDTIPAAASVTAPHESTIYQLRVYGLVDKTKAAFHARFRDRAMPIMKRHGFNIVATWETRKPSGPAFVYLLKWTDEATMKKSWTAFLADPEWVKIKAKTPASDKPIMRDVEQDRMLRIMDYSPTRP